MKRNVLILTCLLTVTVVAFGQRKKKKSSSAVPDTTSTLTIAGTAFLRPLSGTQSEPGFDYKQLNAPLPKFTAINYENKDITKELTESGGNLILMMFNPTCDHCQDEARLFTKNIFLFQKSKILLVAAPVQTPNIAYFESVAHCSIYPSTITVAVDSAKIIDKLFTYKNLPQINIYDSKSMRLLRTFEGFVPLDSLKQYIQ